MKSTAPVRHWSFACVLTLAVALVVHAAYFDWSDLWVHTFFAAMSLLAWIRWPRAAVAAMAFLWLLLVMFWATGWFTLWDPGVRAGDPYAEVEQRLGSPELRAKTAGEARALLTGRTHPSPLRFRHDGPVDVHVHGKDALWVFHDGQTVKAIYVGRN